MIRVLLLIMLLSGSFNSFAQNKAYLHKLDAEYTSPLFRGDNAYALVPMRDVSAVPSLTVFQYLQGRVPGLMIYGSDTPDPLVLYRSARPAFFLDEVRVQPSLINSINMSDVAYIKVFRPPFFGALGGGYGAIAVYTKKGGEDEE